MFPGTLVGGQWGRCCRASLTCPQADHDSQVLRVFLHDDSSQDLAAQQGGLETVGQSVEAPVAQHSYLVMEGAASERELWGQEAVSEPQSRGCGCHVPEWAGRLRSLNCEPSFPLSHLVSQFHVL